MTWDRPPSADDITRPVGIPSGMDPGVKVWKTAIMVNPGVSGTVSIRSPKTARIFVTTWDQWDHLSARQIQLGSSSEVDLVGCVDGIRSYPGLTILDEPACVVIDIQLNGEPAATEVRVPFFGAKC